MSDLTKSTSVVTNCGFRSLSGVIEHHVKRTEAAVQGLQDHATAQMLLVEARVLGNETHFQDWNDPADPYAFN